MTEERKSEKAAVQFLQLAPLGRILNDLDRQAVQFTFLFRQSDDLKIKFSHVDVLGQLIKQVFFLWAKTCVLKVSAVQADGDQIMSLVAP